MNIYLDIDIDNILINCLLFCYFYEFVDFYIKNTFLSF